MQLDHLFVICRHKDLLHEVVQRFQAAGFSQGTCNRHPGQGTANYRFFFHGFMFELLYVDDEDALHSRPAQVLKLANRFESLNSSLFGIASRPSQPEHTLADYRCDEYRPAYLPDQFFIQVAADLPSSEPLWFHLPFVPVYSPDAPVKDNEPRNHANGIDRLTHLEVFVTEQPSDASCRIAEKLDTRLRSGNEQCAHLVFDSGRQKIVNNDFKDIGLLFSY